MRDFSFPLSLTVQMVIFVSLCVMILLPLYLAYVWAKGRNPDEHRWYVLLVPAFCGGFLYGGAMAYVLLLPPQWHLSFMRTLQAAIDPGHFYGQHLGFAIRDLATWVLVFCLSGGLFSAAAATLGIQSATGPGGDK
jgi:Sec-independent protein secretion pathway component TatC